MGKRIVLFLLVGVTAGVVGYLAMQRMGRLVTTPASGSNPASAGIPAATPVDLNALKAKADGGDPAAQTSLGWVYVKGETVKPDIKSAVRYFQHAADQNYPDALAALGEMNQAGQGVPMDLTNAARLFQSAAEKGSVAGQYDLAYLYEQGTGVKQSETDAAKWYELAAEGGDSTSEYDIGQRYELGVGVQTNLVQAFKWLSLASAQGQTDATQMLGDLKSKMTDSEIDQAKQLISNFTPRSALVAK